MRKTRIKLLLLMSLSASLILGCLSVRSQVFAAADTDPITVENTEASDNRAIELDVPSVGTPTNQSNGVAISWSKSTGADGYYIYRRVTGGSWIKIATVSGESTLSYIDTTVSSGITYEYTVGGYYDDGTEIIAGDYDTTGKSIFYVAAPVISKLEGGNNGITITWNQVNGAVKYRVFYKTGSDDWKKITDTDSTSYTWTGAKPGTAYTFTVRCISGDAKTYTSSFDSTGRSLKYIAIPKLSDVSNVDGGVKISWEKSAGAEKYRVYYKIGSGKWTKIADTTATSYTWTGANAGTTYCFTVRGISSDAKSYTSGYDSIGKSLKYISSPKLTSVSADNNGVKISWEKSVGAEKYRVYYKIGAGTWTKIADTTAASYTWTGAKVGTAYQFTVRCISSDAKNYTSGYDSAGLNLQYIATPKLTSVSADNNGVNISWEKSAGAEKYRVYYKTGSGIWTRIADTTSTSYTWTGATSGTTYQFTVRCISSDAKSYTSGYDSIGLSLKYIATPKLTGVSNESNGVKISWEKSEGAEKYRVYYKTGSGNWTKIADTTATSYIWTGAASGTTYRFTVRCISSDAKSYTSDFERAGLILEYIAAPKLTRVSNLNGEVNINWEESAGAEKYRVYYKTGSGIWTRIADTTSTNYIWTGAKEGVNYTFTVRCISSDAKSYTSSYDSKGLSVVCLAQPNISRIEANNSGVKITWNKVTGAASYRVYCKSASGWTFLKETADTTCTVNATIGADYIYTVKAVNGSSASTYDTKGTTFKRLEIPEITGVYTDSNNNSIKISWTEVTGADKYRVYYQLDSGSWIKITDTTSTSYTWTSGKKDISYRFTVRCISDDAKTYTSGYDPKGKRSAANEEQFYAAQVLDQVGWNLWAAFKWSASMPYFRECDDIPDGYTKCKWYSLYGFNNYRGNCHVMACTFYQMAILLGYDAHYVYGYVPLSTGGIGHHGWVEIVQNGTVYVCDPDFALYRPLEDAYMFTYGTKGTWRYQDYHREN